MRIVETHDPEVMRLDDDSVLSRLVGFVIILTGVGLWVLYLSADSKSDEAPSLWDLLLVLGGGLVSAVAGLTMMLYAGQTIIDRRLGKVAHWQRFLWWQPRDTYNLADFERVAVIRSGYRYVSWGVELQANTAKPERSVLCGLGLTRSGAGTLADRIAQFSGLATEEHSDAPEPLRR